MKVGIIGCGFVGRAVHNIIVDDNEVFVHDPFKGFYGIDEILEETQACFICVPTPTINGKQDLKQLYATLNLLTDEEYKGLIIIKSTVLPSNIKMIIDSYALLNIMVSPEFLNQFEPYYAQQKHLIGVTNIEQAKVYRNIFNVSGYGHADVRTTDPVTAMMIKYVHNVYGSLKVTFFNEIYDVCEKEGINYREMLGGLFASTDHISETYTRIGSDGKRGFAGACFPKDSVAFNSDYHLDTVDALINKNIDYRQEEMEEVMYGKTCCDNTSSCGIEINQGQEFNQDVQQDSCGPCCAVCV